MSMLNRIIYIFGRTIILFFASIMLRLEIKRHADLPAGPKIFVANHPSATDPFLIHLISPQPMSVLISANAFAVPVFGSFLRMMKQIPVTLGKGSLAMEDAHHLLQAGGSVTIFPEGDFSPQEGGLRPPRTGAARLALSTGVPVVPVGIHLPRECSTCIRSNISGKPTVGYWYLRGPYQITVGQPMKFEGNAEDREHVHRVSLNIMERIHLLAKESESRMSRRNGLPSPA
jgi:1-acyl-sn-glycerol-3-phosphate acyltransferase